MDYRDDEWGSAAGGLMLGPATLGDLPNDRDCRCAEPSPCEPVAGKPFVRGYVISLPSTARRAYELGYPVVSRDGTDLSRPYASELRLCRACAVALVIAILEHEVS